MIIPISFLMADGNNNIISVFKFSEIKSPFVKSFCYTFFLIENVIFFITLIILFKAGDYQEAHKVIIAEIAPSAILAQNYEQLEAFLRCIAEPSIAEKVQWCDRFSLMP